MKIKNYLKDEKARVVIAVVLAIIFFTFGYLGSYYYKLKDVKGEASKDVSGNIAVNEADKILNDDFIVLFTKKNEENIEEVYYKSSIKELKTSLKVDKLTENDLEKLLAEGGFKKVKRESSNITFMKEEGTGLKPNKYYIGSMDGKLSIYKTDDKGVAYIEKAADITEVPISIFPDVDQEKIKNFSNVYDTREDCEEALTAYTS